MQVVPVNDAGNPVDLAAVFAAGGENANANANANAQGPSEEEKWYVEERVKKKEQQVRAIEGNVYQLLMNFQVFDAAIYTAVAVGSSSSALKCGDLWFPICFMVVLAMASLGGLYVMGVKYGKALDEQFDRDQKVCEVIAERLVADAVRDNDKRKAHWRWLLIECVLTFLILTGINIAAAYYHLCA